MEYEIEYERIDQNKTEQNKTEQRSQCSTMTDNTKETKNKIKSLGNGEESIGAFLASAQGDVLKNI